MTKEIQPLKHPPGTGHSIFHLPLTLPPLSRRRKTSLAGERAWLLSSTATPGMSPTELPSSRGECSLFCRSRQKLQEKGRAWHFHPAWSGDFILRKYQWKAPCSSFSCNSELQEKQAEVSLLPQVVKFGSKLVINENIAADEFSVHKDFQTTAHIFWLQHQVNTEVHL